LILAVVFARPISPILLVVKEENAYTQIGGIARWNTAMFNLKNEMHA